MKVCVLGSGYVGLVAGACLAKSNEVICVDLSAHKIDRLRRGEVPIYEPGLEALIRDGIRDGRLSFTTAAGEAIGVADVVLIAVGTPPGESGDADLQHVLEAARQIGEHIRRYAVVVDKSTVPVGTADLVWKEISSRTRCEFDVVSNPEFLKEGAALEDFLKPDRVVIGTDSERARAVMAELYAPFTCVERPILFMDTRSAELTKYAANAMLATRISFMNDLAMLCERVGADVDLVRRGMGADSRIGHSFLFPGVGYGGSCFPKDVKALVATARDHGLELDLLRAVERTNERQKRLLVARAVKHFGSLTGRNLAVWGLAFKPETDDMREAPSIDVVEGLLGKGAHVTCYDPAAVQNARRIFGDRVRYATGRYEALDSAEALFVLTDWSEFRHLDLHRMKALMSPHATVFDGRNLYEPAQIRAAGFTYYGIGRG